MAFALTRSELMSRIRSSGNKATELRLIEIMKAEGIKGWRRKQKVFGKPDFVFWAQRVAVFVDGCFWHGCPSCFRSPQKNTEFWLAKFERNRTRDRLVKKYLRQHGWTVIRIWEHQLKKPRQVASRIKRAMGST